MSKRMRRKYFVDRDVQGILLKRVVRYWLVCIAAVGMLTTAGWLFVSPGITGFVGSRAQMVMVLPIFVMAIFASLLILPAVLIDVVKLSNRFAGPIFRLRRVMDELADGATVDPIEFRDGDYWKDFAKSFNRIRERIEFLERELQTRSQVEHSADSPNENSIPEPMEV